MCPLSDVTGNTQGHKISSVHLPVCTVAIVDKTMTKYYGKDLGCDSDPHSHYV